MELFIRCWVRASSVAIEHPISMTMSIFRSSRSSSIISSTGFFGGTATEAVDDEVDELVFVGGSGLSAEPTMARPKKVDSEMSSSALLERARTLARKSISCCDAGFCSGDDARAMSAFGRTRTTRLRANAALACVWLRMSRELVMDAVHEEREEQMREDV
jgi:hypothetical protein